MADISVDLIHWNSDIRFMIDLELDAYLSIRMALTVEFQVVQPWC